MDVEQLKEDVQSRRISVDRLIELIVTLPRVERLLSDFSTLDITLAETRRTTNGLP
jgi:hypothetical protein